MRDRRRDGTKASRRLPWPTATLAMFLVAAAAAQPNAPRQAAERMREGRWESAIEILQASLAASPDDPRALNLLGIALSSSGRREEAREPFERAVRLAPGFHPALKNLAVNEMALGRVERATAHFRELLKSVPDDPVAHLALGEEAFREEDFQAAVRHYEKSRLFERRDPGLILKLARAYERTGRAEEAKRATARIPAGGDFETDLEAGRLLAELKDYRAAAERFAAAYSARPNAYEAGFNLALARHRAGQPAAAARVLESVIARGHPTAEARNLLARAYEAAGDTKRAYDSLRAAIELDPADETHYIDLIALCLDHRNFELGLEIADIAVARLPESAELRLQRGVVLAMRGDFDAATRAFDSAAELAPDQGLPRVAMGLAYLQMDRIPEAVATLREHVRRNPDDPLAGWFLGEALQRSGALPGTEEEAEALDVLTRAVSRRPDLVQAHILLAKLRTRAGDLEQAAAHLRTALEIAPDSVAANYQLAQVYRRQGRAREARELFAKVRDVKAEDRDEFGRSALRQIVREGER